MANGNTLQVNDCYGSMFPAATAGGALVGSNVYNLNRTVCMEAEWQ